MNVLDEEVFAVIMALAVVASVFAIAEVLRPKYPEPFTAIGLLNSQGKIGDYPTQVFPGENVSLKIFLANYLGHPALMQVRFKIGDNSTLPTNSTPSPQPTLRVFETILDSGENTTLPANLPIAVGSEYVGRRAALILELWVYNATSRQWVYTGEWNHLYVKVVEAPIP